VDRSLRAGSAPAMESVVRRTAGLIGHGERHRARHGIPPVSYEVGTEEVHGGLADVSAFRAFLGALRPALEAEGVGEAWPCFVVGKVGTDLHTTTFCPDTARVLVGIAHQHGCWVKGHYTDSVSNPEAYPASGMGGANVGPEFTEAEYEALVSLEERERELGCREPSGIAQALRDAVVASGRWMKWRQPSEEKVGFEDFTEERQRWLVRTGCRYIWTDPSVLAARGVLRANLASHGVDAEGAVRARIATVVEKYLCAFNLVGAAPRLLEADAALRLQGGEG